MCLRSDVPSCAHASKQEAMSPGCMRPKPPQSGKLHAHTGTYIFTYVCMLVCQMHVTQVSILSMCHYICIHTYYCEWHFKSLHFLPGCRHSIWNVWIAYTVAHTNYDCICICTCQIVCAGIRAWCMKKTQHYCEHDRAVTLRAWLPMTETLTRGDSVWGLSQDTCVLLCWLDLDGSRCG
jgi:hypothetical protein